MKKLQVFEEKFTVFAQNTLFFAQNITVFNQIVGFTCGYALGLAQVQKLFWIENKGFHTVSGLLQAFSAHITRYLGPYMLCLTTFHHISHAREFI